MRSTTRRGTLLAICAAAAVAATAPTAGAHPVKVVGGKTKLKLAKPAAAKLSNAGVAVRGATLPVAGGTYSFHTLDDSGGGTIRHRGALVFARDGMRVALRRPTLTIPVADAHASHGGEDHGAPKAAILTAVVGGERMAVARLTTKRYRIFDDRPGFAGVVAKLTRPAARLLNRRLGVTVFAAGQRLGALSNEAKIDDSEGH